MSQIIYVNDQDIEADVMDSAARLSAVDNWGLGISYDRDIVSVPGLYAGIAAPEPSAAPRTVSIRVHAQPTTLAERDAQISLLADLFPPQGIVELRFGDSTDKVLEGFVASEVMGDIRAPDTSFVSGFGSIYASFEIVCPDPTKRSRYASCVSLAANTRTAVALGTLPSYGVINIIGSGSNPVLTYRDSGGNTIGTMTFTITLGADDRLVVDLLNKTVKRYDAGVVTDALSTWSAGNWFAPDPIDGSYKFSSWPTLTSSLAAEYTYVRRWRN